MNAQIVYIGADIAESSIELSGALTPWPPRIANTQVALSRWLKLLSKSPQNATIHFVCESTGGCERALVAACHQAGLAVSVLNARHVRHFAQAQGRHAKTDQIDAALLRQYGETFAPAADEPLEPLLVQLAAHSARRTQLIAMRTAEKNRARRADPILADSFRTSIGFLDRQIASIDANLARLVSSCARLRAKLKALVSVKGMGTTSATALLAALPELGRLSKNQAAALAGLAPFNHDSGLLRGQRHIRGGRQTVRQALYMAALVASRHNPVIKTFYQRLLSNGKAPKLALTAAMRKLLIHLNSLLKLPLTVSS
jgi:transposase